MSPVDPAIRTPDQRLRVFVSSTLRELASERRAVRAAIEQLNLAPVMFELGARPHPPRELYRAYLAQSDIFVGLYGERYGWVAPGEDISGLEDEYRLARPEMPKLVYVKEGGEREPRLAELLDRIREDDRASYAYYTDPEQLAELVRGDLATLLAERFTRASPTVDEPLVSMDGTVELPAALTSLIGRERELEAVVDLLADDDVRLVTLTGPGGIGKSRLSIDAANRVHDRFPGGIAFVDLSPVTDPGLVPAAIANALGIIDIGDGTLDEKLRMAVRDRRMLLAPRQRRAGRRRRPRHPVAPHGCPAPHRARDEPHPAARQRRARRRARPARPARHAPRRERRPRARRAVGEPLRRAGARREARLRAHRRQRRGRRAHLHRPRRRAARDSNWRRRGRAC